MENPVMAAGGRRGGFYGVTEAHRAPLQARHCTALTNILTKMTLWEAAYGAQLFWDHVSKPGHSDLLRVGAFL